MIELVKHPVFTEKSVRLIADNQYTFDVDLKLTKNEIKKVIKEIFKVYLVKSIFPTIIGRSLTRKFLISFP